MNLDFTPISVSTGHKKKHCHIGGEKNTHLLLSQELIKHTSQNRLETGRDNVERDVVLDAEVVELQKVGIDLQGLLHHLEAVLERHIQAAPHLLAHITERPHAHPDLLVQLLSSVGTASVGIEENVASVLHENSSIEV
jgi:hypothetical protein